MRAGWLSRAAFTAENDHEPEMDCHNVTALDTVVVSFESEQHPKKIMILLEKESGRFIASWLAPRIPKLAPLVNPRRFSCLHTATSTSFLI
jgi:hypothetical protein